MTEAERTNSTPAPVEPGSPGAQIIAFPTRPAFGGDWEPSTATGWKMLALCKRLEPGRQRDQFLNIAKQLDRYNAAKSEASTEHLSPPAPVAPIARALRLVEPPHRPEPRQGGRD
jgi:hypothetical protein